LLGPQQQEDRKQEQAAPASTKEDVAFFPLTLPFTTGPGTIAVAIALSANGPAAGSTSASFLIGASVAAISVAVIVGACYAQADRLVALLGQSRSRVVSRLAAFILLCVGVQILLLGVEDAVRSMMAARIK
jgi:multiple antibiotic resistance protein